MTLLGSIIEEITNNLDFFSFENNLTQDRYKRFSELCIFFSHCCDAGSEENEGRTQLLKEYLINEMDKLSADEIFRNFYTSYHIILPYVSIRKFKKSGQFEKCLDIISSNRFISSEVPPHRQMEWNYFQYLTGRQRKVSIPRMAILKQKCHLQYLDRDLAYAFTHCLFYATDFGFMRRKPPLKDLYKLKFQLECLIARFYGENDVDLVLELGINYFALLPHININYGVLRMIDHCLEKTSFIEFNCSETTLEKKYHSLLVLGILYALLKTLANSPHVSKARKLALQEAMSDSIFGRREPCTPALTREGEIKCGPEWKAWQIIKQLNTKSYDQALYQQYVEEFGKNPYLAEEVLFYLKVLKSRNESGILWHREFEYLQVVTDRKLALTAEFNAEIQHAIACTAY